MPGLSRVPANINPSPAQPQAQAGWPPLATTPTSLAFPRATAVMPNWAPFFPTGHLSSDGGVNFVSMSLTGPVPTL